VITGPSYPPARVVAKKVQPHFARHHTPHTPAGEPLAPEPDTATIEAIIEAAFWASLRREEGYVPLISLAYLPVSAAGHPLKFERTLPLSPESLTRLGPAVERPGVHLGVWRDNGDLHVWGATRTIPTYCFVLEVLAPGLLVLKHRRGEEAGKYVNLAVLQGDDIKVLNQGAATVPDCPGLVSSLLGFDSPAATSGATNVLIQLAVSMRAHKRGGSLLVVPPGTSTWRKSIAHPISYAVSPAHSELAVLMREDTPDRKLRRWQDALRRAVDEVAGLTAVDGATLITDDYNVLAFGAKIIRRDAAPRVEQVTLTEPIEGAEPVITQIAQIGGTRHLSAAQFVHDQRDALALIASQDGHFTVFAWSPCIEMVHAHRVETLLL
jgi:hypothetical protein